MKKQLLSLFALLLTAVMGAWAQTDLETPLTLEAKTAGTIVVESPISGMQYTLNGGEKQAVTSDAITVAVGDKVQLYGDGTSITSYSGCKITGGDAECYIYGNIMSLVDETGFATATELTGDDAFTELFSGNENLYNHDTKKLVLPATTLTDGCYSFMFDRCTSLTVAPELPATTLKVTCYAFMFMACTSLTAAPKLPATTLEESCYVAMFLGCSNLTSVTCLATDISASMSTSSWLSSVSATGTFIKAPGMTDWTVGGDGIPEGWTVEECASYNASWDSDDEEKEEWTISPATPCEGQDVTATYSGTRHVKSVKIAQGAWAQTGLTPNDDKTVWTLAAAPAYDLELQAEYYTDLLDSEDNANTYAAITSTADIWLGRTLQTGGYNTFAVPFDLSSETMTELGITAKVLTSSSFTDGVLTLNFEDAESIEAGKPYLVKVSESVENPTFDGVTVSSTAVPNTETNAVDFIPTLGATTIAGEAKNILFLGAGNKLYNPSAAGQNMKGFRAYFQLKGEAAQGKASAFVLNFDHGETTGINSINNSKITINNEVGIYMLDGRRIQGEPTQKGVYIVNGKKIVK